MSQETNIGTNIASKDVQVSWSKETDKEPGRDFPGTVVKAEYPYRDENAKFEGEQIRLLVRADPEVGYNKLQPIWLPPSAKKGSKFAIFRDHIAEQCQGAFREILPAIQSKQSGIEQLQAFCQVMVGMRFQFTDKQFPKANAKSNDPLIRLLCPTKYLGRGEVKEVVEEKVQL